MARKGLIVHVYRSKVSDSVEDSDCTNGGISTHFNIFVLTGEGVSGPFESREGMLELKLVRRKLSGKIYLHAEPVSSPDEGNFGWMFGGNYISASDSRFPNDYPIAIHDRQESSKLHASMQYSNKNT